MKIDSLKQLEQLLKLARKHGVEGMEVDSIKFNLGPEPRKRSINVSTTGEAFPEAEVKVPAFNGVLKDNLNTSDITPHDSIKSDELTEEQLLMWSATGELTEETKGQ